MNIYPASRIEILELYMTESLDAMSWSDLQWLAQNKQHVASFQIQLPDAASSIPWITSRATLKRALEDWNRFDVLLLEGGLPVQVRGHQFRYLAENGSIGFLSWEALLPEMARRSGFLRVR